MSLTVMVISMQYFEEKFPDEKPLLPVDLVARAIVRQVSIKLRVFLYIDRFFILNSALGFCFHQVSSCVVDIAVSGRWCT